ncbi:DUF397 domain-containing protein [Streptomyces sp. NPDC058373]|uniref:DUF397 domain-containing protein n=1 Tax=Streptomyces sp. NPDC058373 TaxID=3346465 RepID=UPI003658FEEA
MNAVDGRATGTFAWFKSSYSGAEGGDCVEVATLPATILVRDSKQTDGPVLGVSRDAWNGFVTSVAGD